MTARRWPGRSAPRSYEYTPRSCRRCSSATVVRVRDGKVMMTDGPFAETKEHLAGLYILNCKDLGEASAMAAMIPNAVAGSIEIRLVIEF
jgi:hypothetical protein